SPLPYTWVPQVVLLAPTVQASRVSGGTNEYQGGHSLALDTAGNVWAWGWNAHGQLGDGTTTDRDVPVQLTSLSGATASSAGGWFSMALKPVSGNGVVYAWGDNTSGQLGDGTTTSHSTPAQVSGLSGINVVAIAAGENHALALASNGDVWAWGDNFFGEL